MGNKEVNYPNPLPQEQQPNHLSLPCTYQNLRKRLQKYHKERKQLMKMKSCLFCTSQ